MALFCEENDWHSFRLARMTLGRLVTFNNLLRISGVEPFLDVEVIGAW